MMTLTEFVLARIADDPDRIRGDVFSGIMQHYGLDEADDDDQAEASEITDAVMAYLQPRVLAECEAKRRIVERASAFREPSDESAVWDRWDQGWAVAMEGVLPLLALPSADHPDYDESWRP